jgi:hypothetical protein
MEYTLSVYLPEVAMQGTEIPPREELCRRAGIKAPSSETSVPLLVQLLKQLKQNPSPSPNMEDDNTITSFYPPSKIQEPTKLPETSAKVLETVYKPKEEPTHVFPEVEDQKKEEDDIIEDIVEEYVDQNAFSRDDMEGMGASASLGVDQSIDTMRMDEYDYMEEINYA